MASDGFENYGHAVAGFEAEEPVLGLGIGGTSEFLANLLAGLSKIHRFIVHQFDFLGVFGGMASGATIV